MDFMGCVAFAGVALAAVGAAASGWSRGWRGGDLVQLTASAGLTAGACGFFLALGLAALAQRRTRSESDGQFFWLTMVSCVPTTLALGWLAVLGATAARDAWGLATGWISVGLVCAPVAGLLVAYGALVAGVGLRRLRGSAPPPA